MCRTTFSPAKQRRKEEFQRDTRREGEQEKKTCRTGVYKNLQRERVLLCFLVRNATIWFRIVKSEQKWRARNVSSAVGARNKTWQRGM